MEILWGTHLLTGFQSYSIPFLMLLVGALLLSRLFNLDKVPAPLNTFSKRYLKWSVTSENSEIIRINILRILTGLILLHRTLWIVIYQWQLNVPLNELSIGIFVVVCAFLLVIGLFTPWASLVLLIGMQSFDEITKTSTLGTDVLQMILIPLTFIPAGTRLSLDAWLSKRSVVARGVITVCYRPFGQPLLEKISLLKFFALLSYGMVCIYSALFHLTDPAWMQGYANALLLTSSYLSQHYAFFRDAFTAYPLAAKYFSGFTIYGMMIWELLLLPLVFLHRYTRALAVFWGLAFILASTFLLQLGWLPYYEYVLFALLFWQVTGLNSEGRRTLDLLYDDRCNLCDRTVSFLLAIDLFKIVRPRPLSANQRLLVEHNISVEEANKDLYGLDIHTHRSYAGYALYLELSRRMFFLLPLFPFLLIGRITRIGPLIYTWIAQRRTALFGVCLRSKIPHDISLNEKPYLEVKASRKQYLLNAVILTYSLLMLVYVCRLPLVKDFTVANSINEVFKKARNAAEVLGLTPINVFNDEDLRMSESYYTIVRTNSKDEQMLLPFTGPQGERLAWHNSDRLYFGNSLIWRRAKIDPERECFRETDLDYVKELVRLDYLNNQSPDTTYRIGYYKQNLPDKHLLKEGKFSMPLARKICTVVYVPAHNKIVEIRYPHNRLGGIKAEIVKAAVQQ